MSETIQIPKGWELRKLGDVLDVLPVMHLNQLFLVKLKENH